MVWLLNSQGMKNCKSTESLCLSILTIYTNDWSPFWYVYCCHVYFFFCEIPKYVQAKNRLAYLDWHFMEWASMLTKLVGYNEYRLGRFHRIRNFFANEIYHFQGCPIKHAVFLPRQSAPCNSSLFSQFCLFRNAILRKMLRLGFWNCKSFFSEFSFHWLQHFFSLVLVICLSWYLHLALPHEFLTFISFNMWRLKFKSI